MNLEKIKMPFGLLMVKKPEVAEALKEHYDAGKPVQYWGGESWVDKISGFFLHGETVYRAAPGSTDRKPKKPKVTPLVVTDWKAVGDNVVAVSRGKNGWINLHGGEGFSPYYSHGTWNGDIIIRVPPGALSFIDPGTCKPEDSLVWRPSF